MSQVLVLQSFRDTAVSPWLDACLASVRSWAALHGYQYRFVDDAFFEMLPAWYREKVGPRKPILADLARLLWMHRCLEEAQVESVVWVDADLLVFAPERLTFAPTTSCVFGREIWLQEDAGKLRTYRNVHNAFCGFRRGCVILPFLIEAVERLVRRVDADRLAPQFVGPKLLTSLHNIVGFELEERVGAISPLLARSIVDGDDAPLAALRRALGEPLAAANLCASLHADDEAFMQRLVAALGQFRSGLK